MKQALSVFQYRKRYGLHAMGYVRFGRGSKSVSIPQAVWIACNNDWCFQRGEHPRFNTASGMDCMQCKKRGVSVSAMPFQYRKRYGLHAIGLASFKLPTIRSFNTASGMDCMQFRTVTRIEVQVVVSIPQAVWIACNVQFNKDWIAVKEFQYRKRYGLHAISIEFDARHKGVSIPQAVWIACNSL